MPQPYFWSLLRNHSLWLALWAVAVVGFGTGRPVQLRLPLKKADSPALVVQLGHSGSITSVAFSPDGTLAVSGGLDRSVKVWEVTSGREIRTLRGHLQGVNAVAVSPDGKTVASASGSNWYYKAEEIENDIKLWDITTGHELKTLRGHRAWVSGLVFSQDGSRLFSSGGTSKLAHQGYVDAVDGTIRVWDVASGTELKKLETKVELTSLALSPGGQTVAAGSSDMTVRLWDVPSGAQLYELRGHRAPVWCVAFSPDGKWVLSGSGREQFSYTNGVPDAVDNTVRLWNAATGALVHIFTGHSQKSGEVDFGKVSGVGFTPDGTRAFSVSFDQTVRLWNLAGVEGENPSSPASVPDARMEKILRGHTQPIKAVTVAPDGKTLLSAGADKMLRLWNVTTGNQEQTFAGHASPVHLANISPDGRFLVTGGWDQILKVWDTGTGREMLRIPDHFFGVREVVFTPDSRLMATTGSGPDCYKVKLWEVETGTLVRTLTGHQGTVGCLALSPDGKWIATGSYDRTVKLWEVATGKLLQTFSGEQPNEIRSLAFSPDATRIVSASFDPGGDSAKALKIWDVSTGKVLVQGKGRHGGFQTVVWSPDGKWIATGNGDVSATLWDAATGIERLTVGGVTAEVMSVAFAPDGRSFLCGSKAGSVELRRTETGELLQTFAGHSDWVESVAFLPQPNVFLSAGFDGTVKLWRISPGTNPTTPTRELCVLTSFDDGHWAVVTPAGRFDTDQLDGTPSLHWVMPDDPVRPLALELFLREYYEPRLLPRLLAGETFQPVRGLEELNRAQPQVAITSITPNPEQPDSLDITVTVKPTVLRFSQPAEKTMESGMFDLRLFRNGQLVGFAPETDGALVPNQAGAFTRTFTRIRYAQAIQPQTLEFTAYAFNRDRIKSPTAKVMFQVPAAVKPPPGRAWLVNIGVNAYDQPDFDLNFAANDARILQRVLSEKLKQSGQFSEVVTVPLISEAKTEKGHRTMTTNQARKSHIKGVFELLAGKKPSVDLSGVPHGEEVRKATPADFLLISFAAHGYRDDFGTFYFVPSDTGPVTSDTNLADLLTRFISNDELSEWLREVDAGEIVLIADACHSAALVEGEAFKPAPMGSRGLGQLAYDKGLRILSATQSDNVALENQKLQHGLLTYALVREGIEARRADFQPEDHSITLSEWLHFGLKRVPGLFQEIKTGKVQPVGNKETRILTLPGGKNRLVFPEPGKKAIPEDRSLRLKPKDEAEIQRPALFDFTRNRKEITLGNWPEK
ncbi:MAG: caspase family protein [Blastocatellia bacterium]|nr:caspase family protein [Blastocatellia bacterium]